MVEENTEKTEKSWRSFHISFSYSFSAHLFHRQPPQDDFVGWKIPDDVFLVRKEDTTEPESPNYVFLLFFLLFSFHFAIKTQSTQQRFLQQHNKRITIFFFGEGREQNIKNLFCCPRMSLGTTSLFPSSKFSHSFMHESINKLTSTLLPDETNSKHKSYTILTSQTFPSINSHLKRWHISSFSRFSYLSQQQRTFRIEGKQNPTRNLSYKLRKIFNIPSWILKVCWMMRNFLMCEFWML